MSGPSRWKPQEGRPDGQPSQGRGWKIALVAALLVLLAGGVIGWFSLPSPFTSPVFVPLAVYEYPAGIPPLPFLRQDTEALLKLGWSDSSSGQNSQQLKLLRADLEGLAKHPPSVPLVVYLAGYFVEHEGKVYLFPAEAKLDQPRGWLPMAEVFRYLRECPAQRKVLLLDVMRPLIVPAQGQLRSDGVQRLWPLLLESVEEDKSLSVLTACSPGQVSHASEELGHSAFGYFLGRGLAGEADGWMPNSHKVGRVNLKALADYVRVCVDHWAQKNRGERQTPVLLGDGDFPLTLTGQREWEASPLPDDFPAWLKKGWLELDGWYDQGIGPPLHPVYNELASALLDAETLWRAGFDPKRVQADLGSQQRRIRNRYAELAPPPPGEPTTLARLAPPAQEEVRDLQELLGRCGKLPAKPPDDQLMPIKADMEALGKKHKEKPAELALLAVTATAGEPFSPKGAQMLAETLGKVPGTGRFDEVRFLLRLSGRADKDKIWSSEVARLAVEVAQKEARTRAFSDEALVWVRDQRRTADALRAEVESSLFSGEVSWEKVRPNLLELRRQYLSMQVILEQVQAAIERRDAAACLLPGLLLSERTKVTPSLRAAVRDARRLKQVLAAGPGGLAELPALTDSLRQGPNSLHSLLASLHGERFPLLIARMKEGRLADLQEGQTLLLTACPATNKRLDLWQAYRDGARECESQSMEALGPPESRRGSIPSPAPWDERATSAGQTALLQRDLNRAELLVLRLRLTTGADLTEADAPLGQLQANVKDDASWKQLASVLKKAER